MADEAKIQRIVDMGFSADAAERALAAASGNLHEAVDRLFADPASLPTLAAPPGAVQPPRPSRSPQPSQLGPATDRNVGRIVELGFTELAAEVMDGGRPISMNFFLLSIE